MNEVVQRLDWQDLGWVKPEQPAKLVGNIDGCKSRHMLESADAAGFLRYSKPLLRQPLVGDVDERADEPDRLLILVGYPSTFSTDPANAAVPFKQPILLGENLRAGQYASHGKADSLHVLLMYGGKEVPCGNAAFQIKRVYPNKCCKSRVAAKQVCGDIPIPARGSASRLERQL
ncbi:UNVERIFIED_ORG: hypothetical protein J2W85_004483 [Ensifer adhaerens]|nr:hypothetical protein [Ensifer adhaerens]